MTTTIKIGFLGLAAAILTSLTSSGLAQTNLTSPKKVTAETNAPAALGKKPSSGPFHGKLVSVDKHLKTITVGKRTFQITSETKLKKAGKPATLDDGVVGEPVSGYAKSTPDGKLLAKTVNFGAKPNEEGHKSTPQKETK